jgi:N-acetylmuramoyl-L-alanine amidase
MFNKISGLVFLVASFFGLLLTNIVLATEIKGLRMWSSPENTRLVFDINSTVEHKVFVLNDPHRVVVDIRSSAMINPFPELNYSKSLVAGIRHASRNEKDLRVVLDMKSKVKPKSFLLKPTQNYGHRLVLDLQNLGIKNTDLQKIKKSAPTKGKNISSPSLLAKSVIIAIDAGHGGEDPGAVGPRGTKEKDVVFAIAKKLAAMINKQRGMRAIMIRQGDYYVSLRRRMNKARDSQADLFISIHADAVRSRQANGASIYVLSQKGASSEAARWLAKSQNGSDLIGGVSLDDKDDLLASVLLDLTQNATIAASSEVATIVLRQLKKIGNVHRKGVEQAGFVVLKSPDIPSILVETGFISNIREEGKLRDRQFQGRIAAAMINGIKKYLQANPPPGSLWAVNLHQHIVDRDESVVAIDRRY